MEHLERWVAVIETTFDGLSGQTGLAADQLKYALCMLTAIPLGKLTQWMGNFHLFHPNTSRKKTNPEQRTLFFSLSLSRSLLSPSL